MTIVHQTDPSINDFARNYTISDNVFMDIWQGPSSYPVYGIFLDEGGSLFSCSSNFFRNVGTGGGVSIRSQWHNGSFFGNLFINSGSTYPLSISSLANNVGIIANRFDNPIEIQGSPAYIKKIANSPDSVNDVVSGGGGGSPLELIESSPEVTATTDDPGEEKWTISHSLSKLACQVVATIPNSGAELRVYPTIRFLSSSSLEVKWGQVVSGLGYKVYIS